MGPGQRKVSMLELDRHLSLVLEQARDAPVSVQRYGHPWVWILSCDAWSRAARWENVETNDHPLLVLRRALDPLLGTSPPPVLERLAGVAAGSALLQRVLVLMYLRRLDNARRLHDGLHYNILYRSFVGFDHGSAWSMEACHAVLQVGCSAALSARIEALLARVPPALVTAACCTKPGEGPRGAGEPHAGAVAEQRDAARASN